MMMNPVTPSRPAFPSTSASGSSPSSSLRSSPLNPEYRHQNPPSARRASMHNEFRVQSRYIRPPAGFGSGSSDGMTPKMNGEEYQRALRRERFKKTCAERAERDRVKFRHEARARGGSSRRHETSSVKSVTSDDMDMDDFDDEELDEGVDDPLYAVYMMDERRRANYAQRVSYQQAVGSSIDPDMEDFDEYERHFTAAGRQDEELPPSEDEVEYGMIPSSSQFGSTPTPAPPRHPHPEPPSNYLQDEDIEVDIEMPFSSPPPSPPLTHAHSRTDAGATEADSSSFMSLLLDCPCPYCSAPYSLYSDASLMTCAVCTESFDLGTAKQSWEAVHPFPVPGHSPLTIFDPSLSDGIVMTCSDDLCSWGVSL